MPRNSWFLLDPSTPEIQPRKRRAWRVFRSQARNYPEEAIGHARRSSFSNEPPRNIGR